MLPAGGAQAQLGALNPRPGLPYQVKKLVVFFSSRNCLQYLNFINFIREIAYFCVKLQPMMYWYPSPPVSPQSAYYMQGQVQGQWDFKNTFEFVNLLLGFSWWPTDKVSGPRTCPDSAILHWYVHFIQKLYTLNVSLTALRVTKCIDIESLF